MRHYLLFDIVNFDLIGFKPLVNNENKLQDIILAYKHNDLFTIKILKHRFYLHK